MTPSSGCRVPNNGFSRPFQVRGRILPVITPTRQPEQRIKISSTYTIVKPFEPANEKILHFKSLRTDIRTESDATASYDYLTARLKSFRQPKASEGSALAQSTALGPCARTQPSHPHGPQSSTWIAGAYRLTSKRCRSVADRFLFNHVGSVCANVIYHHVLQLVEQPKKHCAQQRNQATLKCPTDLPVPTIQSTTPASSQLPSSNHRNAKWGNASRCCPGNHPATAS